MDDFTSPRGKNPLEQLLKQDLGPLSVADLHDRIAVLESEIERTRAHITQTASHRASAEALFRK